jgi:hypothetical protein
MSFIELRRHQIERHRLAEEITGLLSVFEQDLGRALASGSSLIGFLPVARNTANVSATVGQGAINEFVASLALIAQAMGAAVEGHHRLDEARSTLRIPAIAGGDKDTIPSAAAADPAVLDTKAVVG